MTIIGFCNPLLDISLNNHPEIPKLLLKYDLKDNDIILADLKKHGDLIEDMKALGPVEYSAGGAGLNSLRCAQLLLDRGTCRIVGSIGTDSYGQVLLEKSLEVGLLPSFQSTSPKPTGKCACLIHGEFRSLVAFLDAANDFNWEHVDTVRKEIIEADYLYITGFFYSVSPLSVKKILEYRDKSRIIFNLSATFVPSMISEDDFDLIMKSAYILIGNVDEFNHLKRKLALSILNIRDFAYVLTKNYPDALIIVTQGGDPIFLFSNSDVVTEIPVPPVDSVVDTNGAGDAFIGGILGGLERGLGLIESIKIGCFMSGRVISQSGIHPPSRQELETHIKQANLQ